MHPEPAIREPRFVKILVLCTAITRLENRRSPMSFSQIRSLMSFSTYVCTYVRTDVDRFPRIWARLRKSGAFAQARPRSTAVFQERLSENGVSARRSVGERRLFGVALERTALIQRICLENGVSPDEFLGKPQLSNHGPGVTDIAYGVLPFLTPRNLGVLAAGEFVIRHSSSINKVW